MCTLFLSFKQVGGYDVILIANRDEFYDRNTIPAGWWKDKPSVLAGRDLKAGGTWMGINKKGHFAVITNFRKFPPEVTYQTSRGNIVKNFLLSVGRIEDYFEFLRKEGDRFDGFNILFGNKDRIFYYSNRGKKNGELKPSVYALSNHLLDTPWPKVRSGKEEFTKQLKHGRPDAESLFQLLKNEEKAPDDMLPKTGLDLEKERLVSSIFIRSENYGTRMSTVLTIDKNGRVIFHERSYVPEGENRFDFQV